MLYSYMLCFFFFFFKQKTAYEMRISDWSSDVCSSDLQEAVERPGDGAHRVLQEAQPVAQPGIVADHHHAAHHVGMPVQVLGGGMHELGRASCRERVCQYV